MRRKLTDLGTIQEWGQDEVRMLSVRGCFPEWIICRKSEIYIELNAIKSYKSSLPSVHSRL